MDHLAGVEASLSIIWRNGWNEKEKDKPTQNEPDETAAVVSGKLGMFMCQFWSALALQLSCFRICWANSFVNKFCHTRKQIANPSKSLFLEKWNQTSVPERCSLKIRVSKSDLVFPLELPNVVWSFKQKDAQLLFCWFNRHLCDLLEHPQTSKNRIWEVVGSNPAAKL